MATQSDHGKPPPAPDGIPPTDRILLVTPSGARMDGPPVPAEAGDGLQQFGQGSVFRRIRADLMAVTVPAFAATPETPAGDYILHLGRSGWTVRMIARPE